LDTTFYYYSGASRVSGKLSSGSWYQSDNDGEITRARALAGTSSVGSATTTAALSIGNGYVRYYSGGSFGNCGVFYEALGCDNDSYVDDGTTVGDDFCTAYNNANDAYLVRTGFYSYYMSCGGPSSCWLGYPTGNESAVSGGARQTFRNGYLTYLSSSGTITSHRY
jgi:hypothetical protein